MMFSRQCVYDEFEWGNSRCSYQVIYQFSINLLGHVADHLSGTLSVPAMRIF